MNVTAFDFALISLVFSAVSLTTSYVTAKLILRQTKSYIEEGVELLADLHETKRDLEEAKTAADDLQDRLFQLQKSKFSYMEARNITKER